MDSAAIPLEEPDCPLCGAAPAARQYEQEFAPYALATCGSCGFYFLSPRPVEAEMLRLYERADYYAGADGGGYASYEQQAAALQRTFRKLVAEIQRHGVAEGELLEVGCGYGYFLAEARRVFRRRDATDFSPDAARRAAESADDVFVGGIESVPDDRRYDVVVALQVIEHAYAPRQFLRELIDRLRPGGHLVLSAPDMASPLRVLLGARWPSFKIPEHVNYFDQRSLERLMRDAGLAEVRAIAHPHAFPLSLITSRVGLRLPARLARTPIWIPRTVIAAIGRAGVSPAATAGAG